MKLRIKGNSLRLRVMKSELLRLTQGERIEEAIYFGPRVGDEWCYALMVKEQAVPVAVDFALTSVSVLVSEAALSTWKEEDQVGIYATVPTVNGEPLSILIEKDFACLDGSDVDNSDTFDNPTSGVVC